MRYVVARKGGKSRKRVGGTADYIIPIGILALGALIANKFGLFTFLSSGSSSTPPPGYGTPGAVTAPGLPTTTDMGKLTLEASDAIDAALQAADANTLTSPWLPNMYQANPTDASIDLATAQNLFQNILDADGGFWSSGDFGPILGDFQAVVGNQTDISFVSYICQQQKGKPLDDFLLQTNTFGNGGGSGPGNMVLLWAFVQWVQSLPIN
jgi:hypothetical protein